MRRERPGVDAAHLIELLTSQRDLYRRLRELSERQRSVLAGDRPELLLGILRDRQHLVSALVRLNQQLAPYRRDWEQYREAMPEPQRGQAAALLEEIHDLLRGILRSDQEDSAVLAARKQAVASMLNETAEGRLANVAYAGPTRPSESPGRADLHG